MTKTPMTKMTRKQREALLIRWKLMPEWEEVDRNPQPSFRTFRKSVLPTFGMDGAVAVKWCGMWLCIEEDGYTHS